MPSRPNRKKEHQKNYVADVTKQVLEHKYLESEKAGHDLGQAACLDWIAKYAKTHRLEWLKNHLEEAEKALEKLEEDPGIPKELIATLERILEIVDEAKDTADCDGKLEV